MDIDSQEVQISRDDGEMAAHLARPAGPGPHPGLVVLMDGAGYNGHIRAVADRLASEGFVAIAPSLYFREQQTQASYQDYAAMERLVFTLHDERVSQDLRATYDYLQGSVGVAAKVGVIGFCLGGRLAFLAACRNHEFDAYVGFYGHPVVAPPHGESIVGQIRSMKGPLLGIFGLRDRYIPAEHVTQFQAELQRAKVDAQVLTYDAEHGFMKQGYYSPDYYDPVAAADAWHKTMQFLRQRLG